MGRHIFSRAWINLASYADLCWLILAVLPKPTGLPLLVVKVVVVEVVVEVVVVISQVVVVVTIVVVVVVLVEVVFVVVLDSFALVDLGFVGL